MQYNNQPNDKDITEKTQTMINQKGFIISPEDSQTIINQPTGSQNANQTIINPQDSHQTMIHPQDSNQTIFEGQIMATPNETLAANTGVDNLQQRTMLEQQPTQNFSKTTSAQVQANSQQQTSVPKMFANKYQIVGVLGAGAMGKVFEAVQIGKNKRFAIKVIHKNKEGSQEMVKRFYRESKLLAKLNHPNIIKIHEHGEFQGQPYFVMDLVKGSTFTKIIKQSNYPFRRKLVLLTQVLEAVHSAHLEGIIHRDLKPDNIMVTGNGKALVMDFGIARDQGDNQSTKLTKTGMLVGTPLYMSPEQINGEKVTSQSDIYTMGVIMYEVITGKVPFEGNLSKIMWQIAHSDPVHPREISDKIPKNLSAICLKAMVKEQEERYPTARAMANDIKRYLKGQKISVKHPFDPKKWLAQNYRKVVIPIILVCAGLFFALNNTHQDDHNNETVQRNDETQNVADNNPSDREQQNNDTQQNDNTNKMKNEDNRDDRHPRHDRFSSKDKRDDLRPPRHDRFSSKDKRDDRHPPRHDRFSSNKEDKRDDRHPRRDRFSSNNEDNRDDRHPPRHDRFSSNNEDNRDDKRRPIRDRFSSNNENNRDDRRRPIRDRFSSNENDRRHPIRDRFSNEDNRDDRRRPIRDRFSSNENDRRRPIRDRFSNEDDRTDRHPPRSRFSQDNRPTPEDRMIGEHFRYCRECHDLIRKNRIDLGGPPPNWSRVPEKILKKIKQHAQNDR
ncbi:serine/threonine protein kinase [Candidatus Uabimicrobium amorphum]|uniref:non-specific serine/threonine protein kinase n=1 Tax=Uabimicrobium amorphum TaxID=2596890 RepID=A0A5S9ILJ2_UABAM|nr:serine/threonine-protein kinase [Candidatus Uabimicrobium amorphum]BBM83747.1 serine/threonine protein kinase [Candidatus Uabimicrobium amorphum]